MMNVDWWLPKTSERDSLALFPSPIALTATPTSGRVQTPVQHRPYTLKNIPPMTKRASAQKSYEPTWKVAMRHDTSTSRPYVMNYAPYHPPDKPIPPKPPYSNGPINTSTSTPSEASSPFAFGYKNKRQPSPSTNSQLLLTMINQWSNNGTPMATQCHNEMTMADLK